MQAKEKKVFDFSRFAYGQPDKVPASVKPVSVSSQGLKELYVSPDQDLERPLRLLIVGHNPSQASWDRGHYYANPSNRMWPMLSKFGIVPPHFTCLNDLDCPSQLGIGFTDVAWGVSETDSQKISDKELRARKVDFYQRLEDHCCRVSTALNIPLEECYPRVIAFAGVRQFRSLFDDATTGQRRKRNWSDSSDPASKHEGESSGGSLSFGDQLHLPSDWPSVLMKSRVYLLPSSSGAAAMSTEAREGPYRELGRLLERLQYVHDPRWQCSVPRWIEEEVAVPESEQEGKVQEEDIPSSRES